MHCVYLNASISNYGLPCPYVADNRIFTMIMTETEPIISMEVEIIPIGIAQNVNNSYRTTNKSKVTSKFSPTCIPPDPSQCILSFQKA